MYTNCISSWISCWVLVSSKERGLRLLISNSVHCSFWLFTVGLGDYWKNLFLIPFLIWAGFGIQTPLEFRKTLFSSINPYIHYNSYLHELRSSNRTTRRDVWKEHRKSLCCFTFYCTLLSTLLPKPVLFTANGFLYKHVPEATCSSLLGSLCFPSQFWHLSVQNCAFWGCCAT